MTGEEPRAQFRTAPDPHLTRRLVDEYDVQQRGRGLIVVGPVIVPTLTDRAHEGGRQYDVMRTYLGSTSTGFERSAFYSWFKEPLERLLTVLLSRAIDAGQRQTKLLLGIHPGAADWGIIDATTVRLRGELFDTHPGAGDHAASKIHKEWSVGTGSLCSHKTTPTRDHDSPHLAVDETRRGSGIIAELAYVSLKPRGDCGRHDVRHMVPPGGSWKPTIDRLLGGAGFPETAVGGDPDAVDLAPVAASSEVERRVAGRRAAVKKTQGSRHRRPSTVGFWTCSPDPCEPLSHVIAVTEIRGPALVLTCFVHRRRQRRGATRREPSCRRASGAALLRARQHPHRVQRLC